MKTKSIHPSANAVLRRTLIDGTLEEAAALAGTSVEKLMKLGPKAHREIWDRMKGGGVPGAVDAIVRIRERAAKIAGETPEQFEKLRKGEQQQFISQAKAELKREAELGGAITVRIDQLDRWGFNRDEIEADEEFEGMVNSVREWGVLQPLVVRLKKAQRVGAEPRYEVIAGERRWRAAQRVGLTQLLVIVVEASDAQVFELRLVENFERKKLNPVEEAKQFRQALDSATAMGASKKAAMERLCATINREDQTVYNSLKLLELPPELQREVARDRLTKSHARLLTKLHRPEILAEVVSRILRPQPGRNDDGAGVLPYRESEQLVKQAETWEKNLSAYDEAVKLAKARDQMILPPDENAEIIVGNAPRAESEWVSLGQTCFEVVDQKGEWQTWGELVPAEKRPKAILAQGHDRGAVWIFRRAAMKAKLPKPELVPTMELNSAVSDSDESGDEVPELLPVAATTPKAGSAKRKTAAAASRSSDPRDYLKERAQMQAKWSAAFSAAREQIVSAAAAGKKPECFLRMIALSIVNGTDALSLAPAGLMQWLDEGEDAPRFAFDGNRKRANVASRIAMANGRQLREALTKAVLEPFASEAALTAAWPPEFAAIAELWAVDFTAIAEQHGIKPGEKS